MARVKIDWRIKGFEEVRKRRDVEDMVGDSARRIAQACGDGYVGEQSIGKSRARGSVIAVTNRAMNDNRRNNTILNNIDSGRI